MADFEAQIIESEKQVQAAQAQVLPDAPAPAVESVPQPSAPFLAGALR